MENKCQITFGDPYSAESCPCNDCIAFRSRLTKEWKEECDRLSALVVFWESKYNDIAPKPPIAYQKNRIDNF